MFIRYFVGHYRIIQGMAIVCTIICKHALGAMNTSMPRSALMGELRDFEEFQA